MLHILLFLLAINITAFVAFGFDKYLAINGLWRISERTLISMAIFGGSIGAFIGQKFFRHKTKKFKGLLPALIIAQVILIGLYLLGFIKV